jgi:hypothetical protein
MNTVNGEPRSCTRALAHELICASHARPADNVTIAGTVHLEILIELIRHGFSHALCCSAEHGPHMAMAPSDILIAPNIRNEIDLCNVLKRLGGELRPRGVLVFSCAQSGSHSDRNLRRVIFERGFTAIERIAGHGDVGTLWCAHKQPPSLRQAA